MKKTFKNLLSLILCTAMLLSFCLPMIKVNASYELEKNNTGWNHAFNPSEKYEIKSYEELAARYGDTDMAGVSPWIYIALEVFEEAEEETPDYTDGYGVKWIKTDHFVSPGDKLLLRWYYKSNTVVSSGRWDTFFDRSFFNVMGATNFETSYEADRDFASDGLDNVYKQIESASFFKGELNPNSPWQADKDSSGNSAETNFTFNANPAGAIPSNREEYTGISSTLTSGLDVIYNTTKANSAYQSVISANTDEWAFSAVVTVRDTVEKINGVFSEYSMSEGKTGHIGFDEGFTKLSNVRCSSFWTCGESKSDSFTDCKSFNTYKVPFDYSMLHSEDMNHTFIIGEPGSVSVYTASFKNADGETLSADITGTSVTLPDSSDIPGFCFAGWSDGVNTYRAGDSVALTSDKVFTAVYKEGDSPAHSDTLISIHNMERFNNTTVDYKTTITFRADVVNSYDNKVEWYVTGAEKTVNQDGSCTVANATANYTVRCSTKDSSGNVVYSSIETINVNSRFFARIIAFFRGIFGSLPEYDQ